MTRKSENRGERQEILRKTQGKPICQSLDFDEFGNDGVKGQFMRRFTPKKVVEQSRPELDDAAGGIAGNGQRQIAQSVKSRRAASKETTPKSSINLTMAPRAESWLDSTSSQGSVADLGFIVFVHPWDQNQTVAVPSMTVSQPRRKRSKATRPRIQLFGVEAKQIRQALRVFYEIGWEFSEGAKSLKIAAARLEKRSLGEDGPKNIAVSCGNASKAMRNCLNKFFLEEFGLDRLFMCDGPGLPYTSLSEDGWKAWDLAKEYLLEQRLIGDCA